MKSIQFYFAPGPLAGGLEELGVIIRLYKETLLNSKIKCFHRHNFSFSSWDPFYCFNWLIALTLFPHLDFNLSNGFQEEN